VPSSRFERGGSFLLSGAGGALGWCWDRTSRLSGGLEPRFSGGLDLSDGIVGCRTVSGAEREIGDVCDPGLVFLALEHFDRIAGHALSSSCRSYCRTSVATWRTW